MRIVGIKGKNLVSLLYGTEQQGHDRVCPRCNRELPLDNDHFNKNKRRKNGLACYCKECDRKRKTESNRKLKAQDPERWRAQRREYVKTYTESTRIECAAARRDEMFEGTMAYLLRSSRHGWAALPAPSAVQQATWSLITTTHPAKCVQSCAPLAT